MFKPIYTVRASRNARWWAIEVRELRGIHEQARRLDQVDSVVREAIARTLQTPVESFDVAVQVDLPSLGALQSTVEEALRSREAAEKAQSRASQTMRSAVREIRCAGYTARDAGVLLGLSNQRISQIERQATEPSLQMARRSEGSRSGSERRGEAQGIHQEDLTTTSGSSAAVIRKAVDRSVPDETEDRLERQRRALGLAGAFSSGHNDTSERHDEILAEEPRW